MEANAVYYSLKRTAPCCDGEGELVFVTCSACGRLLLECSEDTTVFSTPSTYYEDAIAWSSANFNCPGCQQSPVCEFRPSTAAEIEAFGLTFVDYTVSK